MIAFQHILCPIDFSDSSSRALTYAAALARRYEAQLTVLHVAPVIDAARGAVRDAGRGQRDALLAIMRESVARAGATDLDVTTLVEEGSAPKAIVEAAAALNADLLVMGTHGAGGFHRLLLGSVTEKVTRTAECAVLTVPPSVPAITDEPVVFKRILCAVDYSPSSLKALEYALDLGRRAEARVTVLSAIEYMDPDEPCEHIAEDIRQHRQAFIDEARGRLHALLTAEPRTWSEIEEVVAINRAYKEILQRAAASRTDLIVMGAQGSGGVELMLYGSNAQHVARAASCPVLTVRAGQGLES